MGWAVAKLSKLRQEDLKCKNSLNPHFKGGEGGGVEGRIGRGKGRRRKREMPSRQQGIIVSA